MKKMALLAGTSALALFCSAGLAQTATDSCASAPVIGDGTFSYDLTGFTNEGNSVGACGGSGTAEDGWWQYVAAVNSVVTVQTCGLSTFDTVLDAYTACGGTRIICVDDACGLQSRISFVATAGVPVFLRIADFAGGVHAGQISVTSVPTGGGGGGPANDECSGATVATVGTNNYDNTTATRSLDAGMACTFGGAGNFNADVWYTFTAPSSGAWVVDTCAGTRDTVIEVYSGSCGSLTSVACNDDSCGLRSSAAFVGTAGVTYTIRLASWGSTGLGGTGTFNISGGTPPPANDTCSGAVVASVGLNSFDTTLFSPGVEVAQCTGSNRDGWWSFTPATSGTYEVRTCTFTTADTVLAVYDGACGLLNPLACNDDTCGLQSSVSFSATAGTTYYIQLATFGTASIGGTGQFEIRLPPPPPSNDECETASPVGTLPASIAFDNTAATTSFASSGIPCTFGGPENFSRDLWYTVTPDFTGTLQVDTCGGTLDTAIAVYDGSCAALNLVSCNDDSCGLASSLLAPVTAGTTYIIRVASWGTASAGGSTTINIQRGPEPCVWAPGSTTPEGEPCLGDEAVDTINGGCNSVPEVFSTLSCGSTVLGTASTYVFTDPEFGPLDFRDTDWYDFTATADGDYTFTMTARFAGRMFILDNLCPPTLIVPTPIDTTLVDCPVSATVTLVAGQAIRIFVGTQGFTGLPCSAGNNEYTLAVSGPNCGGCPACPADFDGNGEIEPIDIRAFFDAFRNEEACADVDGNGELEPIDVRAFFEVFRNPGTDPDCPA